MTYIFPSVEGLERAKSDPSEPLYNGSIGSNRIFHMLRTTANLSTSPRWDLFLINVYTLLRNAYSKGITQSAIEKIIDTDVDLLMMFIGAYMSFKRQTPGTVLFYVPDYKSIPQEFLRKTSGQRVEMDDLYTTFLRKLPNKLTELTEDPLLRKFLVVTSGQTFPHKDLPGYIRSIFQGTRSYGMIGTVMISHCPLDLHIAKMISGIELLDSYTGHIYPTMEFGRKLVKDIKVPFNTTTHRVFGDAVHLEPLCKGKQRTDLIELAEQHQWMVMTERDIMRDVTKVFPDIHQDQLVKLRL